MIALQPSLFVTLVFALLAVAAVFHFARISRSRYSFVLLLIPVTLVGLYQVFSWKKLSALRMDSVPVLFDWGSPFVFGLWFDYLGMLYIGVAAFCLIIYLINYPVYQKESENYHLLSSVPLILIGVMLSWAALTPWVSLTGWVVSAFGAAISMGREVQKNDIESRSGIDIFCLRFGGILLAWLGVCILSVSGIELRWDSLSGWDQSPSGVLGCSLMLFGVFSQFHCFPFLKWTAEQSESSRPAKIILSDILYSIAVLAILIRLAPHLGESILFPVFGWVSLLSAFLSVLPGLLCRSWRSSFSIYVMSFVPLLFASLVFSGQIATIALHLGFVLSLQALTYLSGYFGERFEKSKGDSEKDSRLAWIRFFCYVCGVAASGVVGFLGFGGQILWYVSVLSQPVLLGFTCVLFLFSSALLWRTVKKIALETRYSDFDFRPLISCIVLLVFSLGIFWTGRLTGGVIPGGRDLYFLSLLEQIQPFIQLEKNEFSKAFLFYCGPLFIAAVAIVGVDSYSIPRTGFFNRFSDFVLSGYRFRLLANWLAFQVKGVFFEMESLLAEKNWNRASRYFVSRPLSSLGAGVVTADDVISEKTTAFLRWIFLSIGELLREIQNGKLHWYLFFVWGMFAVIALRVFL